MHHNFFELWREGARQVKGRPPICSPPDAASQTCDGLVSSTGAYSRRSRLTKRNGMPHLLDQEKFSAGSDRTDGSRDDRSELEKAAQVVAFHAEPLKWMDGSRGAI